VLKVTGQSLNFNVVTLTELMITAACDVKKHWQCVQLHWRLPRTWELEEY